MLERFQIDIDRDVGKMYMLRDVKMSIAIVEM